MNEGDLTRLYEAAQLPQVRAGMFLIKMPNLDFTDRLHQQLIRALQSCGVGASEGDLITAMRFVFTHEMDQAGTDAVLHKNAADRMVEVGVSEVRAEAGVSAAEAKRIILASDGYWEHKKQADLLLQRQRFCKAMLESMQAALDNHRTARADQRAADQWHAQTAT